MPSGTWVFRSVCPSDRGCQRGASAEAVVISVQRQRIRVMSFALLQWVSLQIRCFGAMVLHARWNSDFFRVNVMYAPILSSGNV